MMTLLLVLLIVMALSAFWAVMTSLILRAAIGLALTSIVLSIIMFQMNAPLAGVFELSVCGGLISVFFISVISLTHRLPLKEYLKRRESRISRFWFLPVLLILVFTAMYYFRVPVHLKMPGPSSVNDVRVVLWDLRPLDLFAQIMILLAGVYGVVVLFKGRDKYGR